MRAGGSFCDTNTANGIQARGQGQGGGINEVDQGAVQLSLAGLLIYPLTPYLRFGIAKLPSTLFLKNTAPPGPTFHYHLFKISLKFLKKF